MFLENLIMNISIISSSHRINSQSFRVSEILRDQLSKKSKSLNVYNFDLNNSHVIPAIIRKIYEAKNNCDNVELWGDGSPLREFTYAKDISEILLFLLENYNSSEPINIGNTNEISIKKIAEKIAVLLNYKGNIVWNTNMPLGQYRKPSCNKNLLNIGWKKENYTSLEDGLKSTVTWFLQNYPNIRGI